MAQNLGGTAGAEAREGEQRSPQLQLRSEECWGVWTPIFLVIGEIFSVEWKEKLDSKRPKCCQSEDIYEAERMRESKSQAKISLR